MLLKSFCSTAMSCLPASDLDIHITLPYSNAVMQPSQQVNRAKMFHPASFRQRIIAAIIFLGVTAYFAGFAIAAHYEVDFGRHLGYCGFQQRWKLPCISCGMTRATLAFAQGRIWEAFDTQPAVALLYIAAAVAAGVALFIAVAGRYPGFVKRFFAEVKMTYMIIALVIILVSGWAVTLARALAVRS